MIIINLSLPRPFNSNHLWAIYVFRWISEERGCNVNNKLEEYFPRRDSKVFTQLVFVTLYTKCQLTIPTLISRSLISGDSSIRVY